MAINIAHKCKSVGRRCGIQKLQYFQVAASLIVRGAIAPAALAILAANVPGGADGPNAGVNLLIMSMVIGSPYVF